jgi:hypothetical protein
VVLQTGSGKTFTMEGPADNRGVNFRALDELFRLREERRQDVTYTLQMSMLEIYNETVGQDLGGGGMEVDMGEGDDEVINGNGRYNRWW